MGLIQGSINWFRERLEELGLPAKARRQELRTYKAKAKKLQLNHRPQAPRRRRMRNHPKKIRSK